MGAEIGTKGTKGKKVTKYDKLWYGKRGVWICGSVLFLF